MDSEPGADPAASQTKKEKISLPLDLAVYCPRCPWNGILREAVHPIDDKPRCPYCFTPVIAKRKPSTNPAGKAYPPAHGDDHAED